MRLLTEYAEDLLSQAVTEAYPEADRTELPAVSVQFTRDPKFGDLQSNFAMLCAKNLRSNPREIAQEIVAALPTTDMVAEATIAGPGFINIRLTDEYLTDYLEGLQPACWEFPKLDTSGTVIIDYSSPNIAKLMHIGHLRSTNIGDAIKRIYSFLGYETIGDNHFGDWGTQFGKLIVAYRRWLDEERYRTAPVVELERLYVQFERESAEDESLLPEARKELKKLQDGDPENVALWKNFIDSSLQEYEKNYQRLSVEFDTYFGESHYHDMMPEIVTLLREKGLATESEGATVVFFDEEDHLHPCIIVKSDGAYLYATSDLACIKKRMQTYDVNRLIYVVDDRQSTHFRQVFRIKDLLGWQVETVHVEFGIMKFADGHFSSRKGNVIYLRDLLDEAERRAYQVVAEKNPDLPEAEKRQVAATVGIGAVKYADLSQNRSSDVMFDWDRMLSLDGNTAPYLQYVYARIRSLLRKGEIAADAVPRTAAFGGDQERQLAMKIAQFPQAVLKAAESYKPNLISEYAFELAQNFNTLYNSTPILTSEEPVRSGRIFLAFQVGETIKQALSLLGIETTERM